MSTFKYKSRAQKSKEKKKINETISKHAKISEIFTSEEGKEGSSSNFGNLMINENIVREEQQPSSSSQNQTETTTEPKQIIIIHTLFPRMK